MWTRFLSFLFLNADDMCHRPVHCHMCPNRFCFAFFDASFSCVYFCPLFVWLFACSQEHECPASSCRRSNAAIESQMRLTFGTLVFDVLALPHTAGNEAAVHTMTESVNKQTKRHIRSGLWGKKTGLMTSRSCSTHSPSEPTSQCKHTAGQDPRQQTRHWLRLRHDLWTQ